MSLVLVVSILMRQLGRGTERERGIVVIIIISNLTAEVHAVLVCYDKDSCSSQCVQLQALVLHQNQYRLYININNRHQ